ncbi:hypothetical protein FHS56_002139 [Thermonema lapsum]|uniref:Uncharacterized protein n=1 Tax=Thermonema lapsum TaxID=28195 RepID=A0A846MSL4_9BACT|nr:hypothetical protein [Thermonema lapsum]NIK74614.1 hypothetical protein [Thermonema lapsum]
MSIDYPAINQLLIKIIEQRLKLSKLNYDDPKYDDLEEELHDMEDELIEEYGDFLEDILVDIHEEVCPEVEVFTPISYVPREVLVEKKGKERHFISPYGQGVWIECDHEGREAYLVILPKPLRVELVHSPDERRTVWQEE